MLYCRRTKNKEQHFVGSICFRVPLLDICIMQSTAHRIHYLDHYSAGEGQVVLESVLLEISTMD